MAVSFVAASAVVTGANPTVAVPSGYAQGDLLVIVTTGTATPTTPAGWTQSGVQGGTGFITILSKFASGTEASVAVTLAGTTSKAVMLAYNGASAIDTVSGFTTATAATSVATGLTGNAFANELEVSIFVGNNVAGTWTAPALTTSRVNSSPTTAVNGMLIVDETQAAAGNSTSRTGTISTSHTLSAVAFSIIPSGRYWVGGTGTWSTATTNWAFTSGGASGAPAPTAQDNVFFDQAATYTVTLTGALTCFDMTVSAGTVTFTSTGTITNSGSISLIAGTTWSATGLLTFNSTSSGRTINTSQITINSPITLNGVGGVWSLGSNMINAYTLTTTLTNGSLILNGFNWNTGYFSSNNSNTRNITFGTNNIVLLHLTAGQTVVDMANATGFTCTGTGKFSSDTSTTGTYVFGTTGGTSSNSPNLTLTGSGTAVQTFTTGSWFNTLNFNVSAFNPGTTSLNLNSLTLSSGGTFSTLTATMVGSGTITSSTNTTLGALTINGTGITTTLGDTFTLSTTSTTTLTSGTLALNGFNLTTGIFSSSNTNTRSIVFGNNRIILAHASAAQTVLNMAIVTNYSYTSSGIGILFDSDASVTRTYVFGTTGGSTTNAPYLRFLSGGTQVQTFTTGSWFNILDFNTTGFNPGTTTLNVSGLLLSNSGTFTGLSINAVGTGTIYPTGKTIAAFTVNNGAGTVTLNGALGVTTYTHTAGTINFATYNLSCSSGASYAAGTLNNIGTITCTTWTVTGAFTFSQGTITPSTSFVLTSGSFTYNSGATLSAVPTFTHTAGTVTLNQAYALTTAGTYTLVAGTLTLGANLTTGSFITTGTGTRAIAFSTNQITLTGNNATIWDGGGANITYTGTPTIVSNYTGSVGTRTINVGTGWTESTDFDVKVGSAVGISIGSSGTDTVAIAGVISTLDLTGMTFTYSPGVMTVYGSYTIPATGGSVSASANTTTFASTQVTPVVITVSRSIDFPITFSGVGGTFNLGANLTTGTTRTTTLTSGTLALNGYNYSTGLFSSAGALARTINFGTNTITSSGSGTVWDTGTVTNLTITGTPVVNVTNATATATTVNSGALSESQAISFNFTAGTYALTFLGTAGYTADSVNFTGFAGTLGATQVCTVYGSYTVSSGMTVTASANTLTFGGTSGTSIITTNGKTMPPVTFNGVGGIFNLGSSLTSSGLVQVLAGIFDTTTNNYSINCGSILSTNGTSIRSIILNDSNVTITNTGGFQIDTQNLTFNPGTSQITLSNVSSTLAITTGSGASPGSATLYDVSYTGGGSITVQGDTITYNNLTFTNGSTAPASAAFAGTQIINGTLSSISTSASTRLILQSLVSGAQVTISAASISLTDIDFQDIYADGAVIPWTGTRLGNLGDNINITFDTGTTKYWSLAAGGNWNAIAWATTSGGTPDVGNFPLPQDTCIIENTGLNTSGTITINSNWSIGTLDMSTRSNAMTLAIGTSSPSVTGNWINGSGTSITGTGVVNFIPDVDVISTITSAAKTFTCPIQVNSVGGSLKLLDALNMGVTNTFTLTQGTLTLNGYNLTTGIFSSNGNNSRLIEFGTNNIILSHTTAATVVLDMADTTNFNYTGTGGFTSGMSVTRTFTCGTIASVGGSILFNGSNQYLSHSTATAYNFGYGDFTVEGWVYLNSYNLQNVLVSVADSSGTGPGSYSFQIQASTNRLSLVLGSNTYLSSTAPIVPLNQWCHIAFVRTNATNRITLWLNGTESAYQTVTPSTFNFIGGGDIRVGRGRSTSVNYFDGYITNVRVVKGVGVYTGPFNPSTYPLSATQPADTNISAITGKQTSLLLLTPNNTNYLKDSSTYNGTMVNNNAATKNALTPFTDFPVAGIPPNLAINSGVSIPTITTNSSFGTLDFTGSTTTPAASTVNITTALTLPTTGTYTSLSINMVGTSTSTITGNSKTIAALVYAKGSTTLSGTLLCTTFTVTGGSSNLSSGTLTPSTSITITGGSFTYSGTGSLGSVATFTHTAGTMVFSKSYSLTTTGTYTFTAGTLTLADNVTLATGIFSSTNTNTRSIAFGTTSAGNINLTHTTAATTVLSMAILTGFSYTGTGGFTVATMTNTRTFVSGTTGGTSAIAPSLTFTTGASVATITTASWFNKLDYGTTSFTQAASTLNVNSITLSATGTYTALILNLVGSGTLTYNGKTTAAVTLLAGTPTLADTIACTTFTVNGPTWNFTSGTLNPTTSFVVTSGGFTYNGGTLGAVATFTHTAGTVQFNTSYSLTATGTYTFTAGTLTINDNITLTTGIFSSNNANTRTINFGLTTPGWISLSHTTAATVVLSMANITGLTVTSITNTVPAGGFITDATITRTFTCGTTGGNAANSPSLYFSSGTALPTFTTGSWFNILYLYNLGNIGTLAATTLNLNGLISSPGGGVYTSMTVNFVGTGTAQFSGVSSGPVNINNGSGLLTLYGALVSTTCTFTAGSVDHNGYFITPATTFTYLGGTFVNGPFITCTTFTLNGPTLTLNYPYQISPSTSFVVTTGTFTLNDGVFPAVPTFTQTAGNVTFNQNYSLTTTGTYTLTAGTLTLAPSVTLNTGIFSSTGAGTRAIVFGTTSAGNINLTHTTAATVVLNMAALGGFSYTGTGGFTVADMANTRTFSVGNTSGGSTTTAPRLSFTTGASIPTLTTASWFNNLDFGTTSFTLGTTSLNLTGDLTLSSSGTYTGLTATMLDTGTATLTTNGKTIAALTINGTGGAFTFADAVTATGALTLTSGTVYTSYAINSGSFASTGTATRGIIGTNITYTITNAGGAFSNASATGITMTGFIINMTAGSAKTFAGGGGTYPVLNNGGSGLLTISGSNTFDTISNSVQPTLFQFTSGTTQTVNNFDVRGIAGSLVTINSSTAASAATLSKASGIVYGAYLSIRDSTATGGATWYAGPTSTSVSNNTGWIFTQLPIITMGNLTVADGGFVISNDPIVFA
jgi:hypothetical protein